MTACIDHLVVTGDTLDAASAHVEKALGVALDSGGRHATMGTHNRLLSMGPDDYLEAIAPDPEARAPCRPRWFGLDASGPPRLSHWVLRVDDLDAALAEVPQGIGAPVQMWRGDYRWRITVPDDGRQPFDGVFPALISWTSPPPAPALPERDVRLVTLTVRHPKAGQLGWLVSVLSSDNRLILREGPPGLAALIHTPQGEVELT